MTTMISATAEEITLQAWKWLTIHRKTRIILYIAALCTLCTFINQELAFADDADSSTNSNLLFLPLNNTTDSHGVPVEAYSRLPLDYGQALYPVRLIRGVLLSLCWAIYTMSTYFIIAAIDFILGLTWLEWLLSPFNFLAGTVSTTIGKLILIPLALTCSALAGAILWGKGAKGTALTEVFIALILSAVAASPIAAPMTYLQGENSALSRSIEYGNEIGNEITTDPNQKETNSDSAIDAAIIDVALRTPAQVLSWGKALDGQCSTKFDEKAKSGADAEEIRKAINTCDEEAKEANETDSMTAFAFMMIFNIAFFGLWAIVLVMLFFIIKDTFFALLNAINVTWRAPLAVFPWGTRYGFYKSFAQMVVNIIAVGACVTVTAIYLWLYGKVTAATSGAAMIYGNVILGIIALVMAYTLYKMKKNGKSLGRALAERMSHLGTSRTPTQKQPSKLANRVKGFAKNGINLGARYSRKRMISAAPKLAAGLATGGTAVALGSLATTAGSAFASGALNLIGDRARAAGMVRRENQRAQPFTDPRNTGPRDANGAFPMPAAEPSEAPTPVKFNDEPKAIDPRSTPAKSTPERTIKPAAKNTLNPGRYQGIRVDKHGNPHNIDKPIEGEIVNISEKKLKSLKKLDSFNRIPLRPKVTPRFK